MWMWKSISTDSRRWRGVAIAVWALALLITVACAENTIPVDPTNSVQPGPATTATPLTTTPTELPQPTEPPALSTLPTATTSAATSTTSATTTSTPNSPTPSPLPTSTPAPTPAPTPPPISTPISTPLPYHYTTLAEAQAGATELGCSGWNNVVIDGISYYRSCANDEQFAELIANPGTSPEPVTPEHTTATPTPLATPYETPVATPYIPPATPTPAATASSLPEHYYTTADEAIAAAIELGCSGWTGVIFEFDGYYRPCGSDEDFEHFSAGGPVTLSGAACHIESDPAARFTTAPTDLSQIASIVTTGSAQGGVIKPHSYFHNRFLTDGADGRKVRVPVYAVADSVLTSIDLYDSQLGFGEYLIFFDVTCEISFKYDHIAEVVPKLAALVPEVSPDSSGGVSGDGMTFEAGELIGWAYGAGGNAAGGGGAWDFGAYDTTFTNQFANQERYVVGGMSQSLHTVCPYDYFDEALKSQMYALLGTSDQRIIPGAECTTTQRDVLGAASGAWFDTLDLGFTSSKFSIANDADSRVNITGGIGGHFRVTRGNPTWLDPELLTTSHCYSVDGRWFYLEIRAEGMQMAVATGTGTCPATLPANATIYYR